MILNAAIRRSSGLLPPVQDLAWYRGDVKAFDVRVRGIPTGRSLVTLLFTAQNSSGATVLSKSLSITTPTGIAAATLPLTANDTTDTVAVPAALTYGLVATLDDGSVDTVLTGAIALSLRIPGTLPVAVPVHDITVSVPGVTAYNTPVTATAVQHDGLGGTIATPPVTFSVTATPDIATITATTGVLTVLADGVFEVIATSADGRAGYATVTVAISTTPASIDPLSSVSVAEGATANPPTVVVRNAGGAIISNPTLSWDTLDHTKATANASTGVVTGVLAGSTSLRVTAGSIHADAALTVIGNVQALKTTVLANGATSFNIFDRRYGGAASTGASDAAGGASVLSVPTGGPTAPSYALASGWTFDGVSQMLATADDASIPFDESTDFWMVTVQTLNGNGNSAVIGHGTTDYFVLSTSTDPPRFFTQNGGSGINPGPVAKSANRRCVILAHGIGVGGQTPRGIIDIDGRAAMEGYGMGTGTGTQATSRVSIGGFVGNLSYEADSFQALAFGKGRLNSAAADAIRKWAIANHGAVRETSITKALYCVGDSRTFGTGATNPTTDSVPALLAADAALSTYDVRNLGIPSAKIQDYGPIHTQRFGIFRNPQRTKDLIATWWGVNDVNIGRTSTQIISDMGADFDAYRAEGWTAIVALPILPETGFNAGQLTIMNAVNAQLAAWVGTKIDAYVSAMASDGTLTTPGADGIHYTTAQYATIKGYVKTALTPYL